MSLISALNVINSGYQVAFMVPTEILAKQHYKFASKFFEKNIIGKTVERERIRDKDQNRLPFHRQDQYLK